MSLARNVLAIFVFVTTALLAAAPSLGHERLRLAQLVEASSEPIQLAREAAFLNHGANPNGAGFAVNTEGGVEWTALAGATIVMSNIYLDPSTDLPTATARFALALDGSFVVEIDVDPSHWPVTIDALTGVDVGTRGQEQLPLPGTPIAETVEPGSFRLTYPEGLSPAEIIVLLRVPNIWINFASPDGHGELILTKGDSGTTMFNLVASISWRGDNAQLGDPEMVRPQIAILADRTPGSVGAFGQVVWQISEGQHGPNVTADIVIPETVPEWLYDGEAAAADIPAGIHLTLVFAAMEPDRSGLASVNIELLSGELPGGGIERVRLIGTSIFGIQSPAAELAAVPIAGTLMVAKSTATAAQLSNADLIQFLVDTSRGTIELGLQTGGPGKAILAAAVATWAAN